MDKYDEARAPETTPERLAELSRDNDPDVRAGVAWNTSAPISILTLLTKDEDDDVVKAAQETLATRSRSTFA